MRQLVVRNVPPEVVVRLKRRAAEHGRSAEAEHRKILEEALFEASGGRRSFKALLSDMPDAGDDRDFERPSTRRRRVSL